MPRFPATALLCLTLAACVQPPKQDEKAVQREEGMLQIAETTRESGDINTATDLYRRAADLSKGNIKAHLALADLYTQQGKPKLALETLEKARALQPDNLDITKQIGRAYIKNGDGGAALKLFEDAITKDPKDASLYNGKAVALDLLGKFDEAEDTYHEALSLNPTADYIRNNLALSLIVNHQYEDAIRILEPLMSESADPSPTVRQNLALAYGLSGNNAKARELGLQDLDKPTVEKNLKFYQYYGKK